MIHDVFASDVVLRDSDGRVVARIDSAFFRPHWRDLLLRTINSGRIELYRPDVQVTFDEAGPNLLRIFRVDPRSEDVPATWSFHSADVRIIDGRISSSNEGFADPQIERGNVFDYSRFRADEIDGRFLVEIGSGPTLLNVRSLSVNLHNPDFGVSDLSGQVSITSSDIELSSVQVTAGGSVARLHAVIPTKSTSRIELAIPSAEIDFDSLRILMPSLPLAGKSRLAVNMQGNDESMVVEHLSLVRGQSSVNISGTLLETGSGIDVELALSDSRLHVDDFEAIVPGVDLGRFRNVESLKGDVYVAGLISNYAAWPGTTFSITGTADLDSPQGHIVGPFTLVRKDDASIDISADVNLQSVLAHRLFPAISSHASDITGNLIVDARSGDDLTGSAAFHLSRSAVLGHALDSLTVEVEFDGNRFIGRGMGLQDGARAAMTAVYETNPGAFRGELTVSDLDAGRWWLKGDSVRTRLDGRVEIQALGKSFDELDGHLVAEVSESDIWHGSLWQQIPAHRHEAHFRQSGKIPFLTIGGDVLELDLRADASIQSLRDAITAWGPALESVLERERLGSIRARSDSTTLDRARFSPAIDQQFPRMRITADAQILDSRILSIIYSDLESVRTDLSFDADLLIDDSRVQFHGKLRGDSLIVGTARADSLDSEMRVMVQYSGDDRLESQASFDLGARAISIAKQNFVDPFARLEMRQDSGRVQLRTKSPHAGDSIEIMATIDPLNGSRRLNLETLRISAADFEWSSEDTALIDIYSDAASIDGLRLASHSDGSEQRIQVKGVLSRHPSDTLSAVIDHVRIGELSEMLRLRHPVDGELNGRILLTWLEDQPELTGHLSVEEARFDDRTIGRVTVQSSYVPGEPDILLDARVSPLAGADRVEDGEAPLNDLRLYGAVRLPTPAIDMQMGDPGLLDLHLDVTHADAFFFDYIFDEISNAHGVLSGTGGIKGNFRRPIFGADMQLRDGGMRIPDFNLDYDVNGSVTVDSAAIRLADVKVDDETGGRAVVNGDILFNEYRYFSFDLRAALADTRFMNVLSANDMGFYGDVRASGNVQLTGPLHAATLSSSDAVIHPDSRVYIAILEETHAPDTGYIVFADSTGNVPEVFGPPQRRHVLSKRPAGERMFVDGLEMDLNILAPQGTRVHLVIDPFMGDVINASANGRIHLLRSEGDYYTYGVLNVDSGDYLFTAGDVFVRRFLLDGGRITWDGDPANASLEIEASYRTRASAAGLNLAGSDRLRIPLIVRMDVMGRVASPSVGLRLLVDRDSRETITSYESLESILNQPERSAEYATSVMLTNTFMLTTNITSAGESGLATTRNQLAFNSLSQLVATQLNRYLSQTLPNVDVNLGLQGESTQDLDVTYGVALRLLDERLVIRGQGLYQNEAYRSAQQNLLDEFVVEVRVSSSVSVEVFYRRENDILASDHLLANTTGAGLSYETQFPSWNGLIQRLFGQESSSSSDAIASGEADDAD